MKTVFFIHWHEAEALQYVDFLVGEGLEVMYEFEDGGRAFNRIKSNLPGVLVVNLTRKPQHGVAVAEALTGSESTCHIPIIFVDGKQTTIEKTKEKFPKSVYAVTALLPKIIENIFNGVSISSGMRRS